MRRHPSAVSTPSHPLDESTRQYEWVSILAVHTWPTAMRRHGSIRYNNHRTMLVASMLAPHSSTRYLTTSRCPFRHATTNGVVPSSNDDSTFALRVPASNFTASMCPFKHAMCSGVEPSCGQRNHEYRQWANARMPQSYIHGGFQVRAMTDQEF